MPELKKQVIELMRIRSIELHGYGPFKEKFSLSFQDEFTGKPFDRVLLSGPNGCGKTSILDSIVYPWEQFDGKEEKICQVSCEQGMLNLRSCIEKTEPFFLLTFTDYFQSKFSIYQTANKVGRTALDPSTAEKITVERKKLLLGERSISPNIVYLDNKRNWVTPNKNIGDTFAEDISRWIPRYRPSQEWKSQIELSMLNLKIIDDEKFQRVLDDINLFFQDKFIENKVFEEDKGRLRVTICNSNEKHTLDSLSSGEQQVIVLIYMISRYMQPGGIVLIDEPDLYLHPSLVDRLLSRIEAVVKERDGQIIIASHNPDIWRRYESVGLRIRLGEIEDE